MSVRTAILDGDIDVAAELARLETLGGGAVASFTGVVRGGDGLEALVLETWPGVADRALADIAGQACARWDLLGATLLHRHGRLGIGERIVLAASAAPHRGAALAACAFLIDWAKTRAPFWKREVFAGGTMRWVEARAEDEAAAMRWAPSSPERGGGPLAKRVVEGARNQSDRPVRRPHHHAAHGPPPRSGEDMVKPTP